MATNLLANILITAVISKGFLAAASPVMPAKPQHPTAQRQMSLEIPVADQQERILNFLSLFDEAQKSALPTADPNISGIKANAKTYGKKLETEGVSERPSHPPSELSKGLLEISPLHGKNFWKPLLPASWKIKRACFWKYCIERK
ncbi:hypothetical protein GRJ2_000286000 [Grus japonensis]|uniref:Uncharacterized protein n=1 Tax=Grus japonensis TaxID=30415 RepID=A0ABC9W2D3_GRUJA